MAPGVDPSEAGDAVVPFRTDVVDAQVIDDMPTGEDAVKLGRESLAGMGVDPDSWVDAETDAQLLRGTPENTLLAMQWGWGRWIYWCGNTHRQHLPGHPNSVRQYIKDHWEMRRADGQRCGRRGQPYAPKTVELAVYAISMVHGRFGFHSPLEDPKVAKQLDGYTVDFEAAGFRTDESDPLTYEQNVALARSQDLGTVNGLRNAAMLRGQFDLGCRAGEWCHVQGEDLVWESEDGVLVTFTRTKTKQPRTCGMQAVRGVDWDVDPVRLLLTYYRARRAAGWDGRGPLWVEVNGSPQRRLDFDESGILAGKFLTGVEMVRKAYEKVFNRAIQKIKLGIDPVSGLKSKHFTTHSNRSGLIVAAVEAGVPQVEVAARTGHSLASANFQKYFHPTTQLGDRNPGAVIRRQRAKKGKP
jgi:integrase